jgi:hypothetical protein
MRTAGILVLGLGLATSGLGCYICQHTAGVCDCDPPPVHYVLLPPPRPAPMGGHIYPVSAAHTLPESSYNLGPNHGIQQGVNAPAGMIVPGSNTPGPVPPMDSVPAMPRASDAPGQ